LITLAGIQPSGRLHIGNYFGSIKKIIDMQDDNNVYAFIANYHAMTTVSNHDTFSQLTLECAIDFLSLGVDPTKTIFWIQSDVKEVLELYWILSNYTSIGLLQRAHSYKDKIAKGIPPNHSLFSYPVLMASDILLYDSEVVPVGKDQIQHIEMTRDIATKFNNQFGDIFVMPNAKLDNQEETIVGLDGQKMSKSHNNTINIFSDKKELEKSVKKIVTDSTPLEEPKEYENCNVYNIAKPFLNNEQKNELQERYKSGTQGYGHFKKYLVEIIYDYYLPFREKKEYYKSNIGEVKEILNDGALKAKAKAESKMSLIREKMGLKFD
jgi:tryptophanyl-tRNA synthetase